MNGKLLRAVPACLALIAALVAGGCGFHMRGAVVLPAQMETTVVRSVRPSGPLVRDLRRSMRASGVHVIDEIAPGAAILDILHDDFQRRVLSVGPTGKAREYEVHYTVRFRLTGPDGEIWLEDQELDLSRNFVFDERDVLGKANEELAVRETLQQDMARLLLMRLEAQGRRDRAAP